MTRVTPCPPGTADGITANYHLPARTSDAYNPDLDIPAPRDELRRLARAKIADAFLTLGGKSRCSDKGRERMMTRAWLDSADFRLWCESADMDADAVLKRALEVYAHGIDWEHHAAPGKGRRYLKDKARREAGGE